MKLHHKITKTAAILALLIGIMSVFAGTKVLIGVEGKSYTVLNCLVVYNVVFGVISILTSVLIWINHNWFKKIIIFILSAHFLVLLYLQFFNDSVAKESIKAMIFRVSIWSLILVLTLLQPKSKSPKLE